VYVWPRLRSIDRVEAQRGHIATLHSFRFFRASFLVLPGVVGSNLPGRLRPVSPLTVTSQPDCWPLWRFLTVRIRLLFLAVRCRLQSRGGGPTSSSTTTTPNQVDLPALAGELGAVYAIPIIYVPLLMITHLVAFYLLVRSPGSASGGRRTMPQIHPKQET